MANRPLRPELNAQALAGAVAAGIQQALQQTQTGNSNDCPQAVAQTSK